MDFNIISTSFAWIFIAGACLVLATREKSTNGALPLALAFIVSGLVATLGHWGWGKPQSLLEIKKAIFLSEAFLPFLWGLYGVSLAGRLNGKSSLPARAFWALGCSILIALAAFTDPSHMLFNPDYAAETILFLGSTGFYFYLLLTVYLVAALVVLERSFAGMSRQNRWRMKFEIIGVGSIITVQAVFYSQALMYRTLDFALNPARNIALVIGVCLFLYSRFKRGYPEKISISDTVVYRSLILLVASFYLIFMGLVGEGLKFFGPSSNRVFILVVALFCGVGLCVVCLSDNLRRKAKVLIHKHFYQHRYDYRVKWLEMTDCLNATGDIASLCSGVLEMYCHTFALRGGALFLRQSGQSDFTPVAMYEWSSASEIIHPQGALVKFLREKRWVFNRLENLSDLAGSDDSKIIERYDIQFAVPLFFNDQVDGFILLGKQINAGEPIIYEDYDLMKAFASQSSAALHNLHLLDQLVDSREMAAIGKVSTFVMHDLKNIVSNLALVVDNAKDHMDDREFQQDMVETLSNSVSRMKSLIDRLKKFEVAPQLALEPCELKKLVEETLHDSAVSGIEIDGDPVDLIVDRQEISRVILNLALNAFEALGEEGGAVKIKTGVNGRAFLVIQDHGCGMTEEYINTKLFKPFETTKVKGFGIGVYQSRQIVEAHGGEMQVMSKPGEGTTFTVWLPVG